jgi:hypothetical protein
MGLQPTGVVSVPPFVSVPVNKEKAFNGPSNEGFPANYHHDFLVNAGYRHDFRRV